MSARGMKNSESRDCVVCGASQKPRAAYEPKAIRIVAITPQVYWRGKGKGRITNAEKVHICEADLREARKDADSMPSRRLAIELIRSIDRCYSYLRSVDGK